MQRMRQPEHPSVSRQCCPEVQEGPAPHNGTKGLLIAHVLTLQGNQLPAKKRANKETTGADYRTTDTK
jgi:hypothetical protein